MREPIQKVLSQKDPAEPIQVGDDDIRVSRSPLQCPVTGWKGPTYCCVCGGCRFVGYSDPGHYIYCAHPDAEYDESPLPEFEVPKVWLQESLFWRFE